MVMNALGWVALPGKEIPPPPFAKGGLYFFMAFLWRRGGAAG
jgi:hypothetical protein